MLERRTRLLAIAFIESFATVLLERGIYFYMHDRLAVSDRGNLYLALIFGIVYVVGAMASHPIAKRIGEKRAMVAAVTGMATMHLLLALSPTRLTIFIGFPLVGALNGLRWPIMESYVSAGLTPRHTARMVGRYNIHWSAAVPLALVASGPMIASSVTWLLFACAGSINLVTLWLCRGVAPRPIHLQHDHPERIPEPRLRDYRKLLTSSRWSMMGSCAMLFLLAPLLPHIFARLGLNVTQAAAGSALIDVFRCAAFAVLAYVALWHGRVSPLALVIVGLPVGFFMALFGQSILVVLLGEVLFGAAAGLAYYAALYYAMVVENASVDAGGAHEGLIGVGFAIGPAAGLIGQALAAPLGGYVYGMLAGIGPLLLLCILAAARPLWHLGRSPQLNPAQR